MQPPPEHERTPLTHVARTVIFDPARRAIVLLGGDKRGNWSGWYERTIPEADDLYDDYLKSEDAP